MEGSIKTVEKTQAMNKYKRADKFLYNFVLYSLTSLITCFFFSYPFWLPSMKHLISSLPNEIPLRMEYAKCFFVVVGNIIVLILVGESKLAKASSSSPALDMYSEYVARSRGHHTLAATYSHGHSKQIKKEHNNRAVKKLQSVKNVELEKRDDAENVKMDITATCGDEEKVKKETSDEKMEETMRSVCKSSEAVEMVMKSRKSKGQKVRGKNNETMPREELNKRVEDFIARVNMRRCLEAKLVDRTRV